MLAYLPSAGSYGNAWLIAIITFAIEDSSAIDAIFGCPMWWRVTGAIMPQREQRTGLDAEVLDHEPGRGGQRNNLLATGFVVGELEAEWRNPFGVSALRTSVLRAPVNMRRRTAIAPG